MDMILCRIDRRNGKLCFAAANNPVWLLRKGEITEYKGDKQPVGIGVENPVPFTEHEMDIFPGDLIYTLTDGYADQFGGTKGKKFKYRALQDLFVSVSDLSMDHQRSRIESTFDEWRGDLEQVDDVLIIGVKI
jgi:serine phosphatase RsbU (regulator of sigma subunit)